MKKFLLFFFFVSIVVSAQEFVIEQLTDGNFEIRNPVFPYYVDNIPGFWWNSTFDKSILLFEVHDKANGSSNIAYLEFGEDQMKFDHEIKYLTNDQFIKRNITATTFPRFLVIWETNRNGSWNIEYTIWQKDSTWSKPQILVGSDQDETNSKIVKMMSTYYYENYENSLWFTFEKNKKIYLAEFEDSLKSIELVFPDTLNYEYSNPTASIMNPFGVGKFLLAAEMKEMHDSNKQIILADKEIGTKEWTEFQVVCDSGNSHNPVFLQIGFDTFYLLSFEIENNSRNSVNLLFEEVTFDPREYDPYNSGFTELKSDPLISTSDFYSYAYAIVTKQILVTDLELYFPFIYKQVKSDSTFIILSTMSYTEKPVFVNIDYSKTSFTVGPVGAFPSGVLSYMVWTDSTENGINLFGTQRYDGLGPVEENELLKKNIYLEQNYPNPFNPTTRIKYQVASIERVSLKVYDILGREVKTLLNKPMQPGSYEVEFDGSDLPSGVYFYRFTSSNFAQTRKMLLIK